MLNFEKLNLNPAIIAALDKKGYTTPTPIQVQAIPHLLAGKDMLGIAQTGTGKTAAFALPILDRLAQNHNAVKANQIRALILTPTRELAIQIGENIEAYGKGLNLKHAVIFGGVNEFHQIKALKTGLDIVVATPGRLLDLMNQGHVRFSQIEIFVLDEADRMLDMGFIADIRKIIAKLPPKKQSLLFSATMPQAISGLAHSILHDPIKIEITPQSTTVERINQKVYLVEKSNKPALLLDVVTKPDVVATLVFCKTKHGANKIVTYLEKYGVLVSAIHGNKSQAARERALKDLRAGKIKVLVATDIAARGIDISNISHVINYDIPADPESYVHRIGRTARAGREGIAISFCDSGENLQLRAVEKAIRMKIPVDDSHPFHGKAATHDASEGRILSRGSGGNRFSNSAKPVAKGRIITKGSRDNKFSAKPKHEHKDSERVFDKRRDNDSDRNSDRRYGNPGGNRRTDDSTSRPFSSAKNRPFAKKRSDRNQDSTVNESGNFWTKKPESTTKKILRKLGFGKFGKNASSSDSNQTAAESFRSGLGEKNRNFRHNKGHTKSSFSGGKFNNRNRKSPR